MPIVPNDNTDLDQNSRINHCTRSDIGDLKIGDSAPCVWYHIGEFESIFNRLEQELSSSLSRRLLHASYSNPFSGFFEEMIQSKKSIFSSKLTHTLRVFEKWANMRMMTGRGMVSVIEWPKRFHVDKPIHAGLEVGEIIHTVEQLTGLSWKATWKDDGGRNLMIHLESIQIRNKPPSSLPNDNYTKQDVGVDWFNEIPEVNGAPIMFLTSESICEFVRLLNEVPKPPKPEKDRVANSENTLEKLIIEIVGDSMKAQLPLILDWGLDHSGIMEYLIRRGIIRNYVSTNNDIKFETVLPRSFSIAPIVSSWEASSGKMANITLASNEKNQHTISFIN